MKHESGKQGKNPTPSSGASASPPEPQPKETKHPKQEKKAKQHGKPDGQNAETKVAGKTKDSPPAPASDSGASGHDHGSKNGSNDHADPRKDKGGKGNDSGNGKGNDSGNGKGKSKK